MKIQKWKIFAGGILIALAVSGFLFWRLDDVAHATGNTILTGGSDITNEAGTTADITDLQITSDDSNPDVAVKLFVSHGTIVMTATTGLAFYNADGSARAGQPSNSAELQFSGAMDDVNTGLASLQYTRTSGTGTDTLSASLVQPGEVFFSGNNHLYEYVAGPATWSQAESGAATLSKYGAQGYLATITSQSENDFIKDRLKSDSWIGASDSASEGVWKWVTGPEAGQQFWQGTGSGNTIDSMYAHWNNTSLGGSGSEPNQAGDEDCAEFYYSNNGLWNDLSCGSSLGYIVEFGAPGNLPTVSSQDVNITTVADATPPSKPGTPDITSPTTDTTPTVSWTGSTDTGSGLKNPAYTLEWSTSSTFATVSGSATTNTTSLATSPALADGTWYFRVKATDNSNNITASDISSAVIIDTTAPTIPGTPQVGVEWTNDNTPTWSWTASVDSGVGLAYIAYAVEWSQDTAFSGLGGTAGVLDTISYTIPDGLNMSDGTWYFHVRGIDALGNESPWSDYGTIHIDTAIPVITNVAAVNGGTSRKETITWTTDKNTSSQVSYGPTSSLGNTTTESDTIPRVQDHSITLDNLVACSIYHFTVTSEDSAGNIATSGDKSFITKGCAGSADVVSHTDTPVTTAGGGNLSLGNISIKVPKGFAADNADFQIKQINHGSALGATGKPSGTILAGNKVYDIKALQNGTTAITSFTKPITITLYYSDADISSLDESSLAIYRWDDGTGWTKLDSCTVDTSTNTVTCTTKHFSTFALYGKEKSASPISSYESSDTGGHNAASADSTTSTTVAQRTKDPSASDVFNASPANLDEQHGAVQGSNYHRFLWWALGFLAVGSIWWILAARRRRKKQTESSSIS